MKKIFSFLIGMAITIVSFAQTPQTINYQAVARNNSGQALATQTIKVRLSIIKNNATQYSETRTVTTNALGLFNVSIGSAGASNVIGNFAGIDWYFTQAEPVKLKVELDINNSNVFTDMGSQDLSTVPYAVVATNAVNALTINGYPVSATAPQTGDLLKWDGTKWKPGKGTTSYAVNFEVGGTIPPGQPAFEFAGGAANQVQVTVDGTQSITAAITATLGTAAAGAALVSLAICYQNTAGGNVTPFYTITSDEYIFSRTNVTASAAIANLPAGTYRIGLGVRNISTFILNQNGAVSGFVTVY